ncbi:hypothetical protein IT575_14335 [bacterium]|nr:hypothetical protein [bacterium]
MQTKLYGVAGGRSSAIASLALAALIALLCSACGGTDETVQLNADFFSGGSLSNFGGSDGGDSDARETARELATGRSFDFTPSGFTISSGPVSTDGAPGSFFTGGTGTLAVSGDTATVTLNPDSSDPNYTDIEMVGTFSLTAAQSTITNPGASFPVEWQISFTSFGIPLSLSATQQLTGSDFS